MMKVIDRLGALTGAAYVVLVIIGNGLSTNSPGPHSDHPTGLQDIADARWLAGSASAQVGISLELISFAAWMLFVEYLFTRLRSAGWLAGGALVAGVVSVALKLGSAAPMIVGFSLRDDISPESARVLTELNGAAFVVGWLPVGLMVACAAAAALRIGALGRVLGWAGVASGSVAVVTTAVLGLNAESGNALPFLLCLLWMLIVSLHFATQRALGSTEAAVSELITTGL
jgi:hypothetical protein